MLLVPKSEEWLNMCMIDEVIEIDEHRKYFFSSQHRHSSHTEKSKWTISIEEEMVCFQLTCKSSWITTTCGWGLHINNEKIDYLGISRMGQPLKIAKFVDKHGTGTWHGYPADYVNNIHDRPLTSVLTSWVKQGYIDKVAMSRISSCKQGGI